MLPLPPLPSLPSLPLDIDKVKGFLDAAEGAALYEAALQCAPRGLCVEIGSYCGKSSVYIGTACKQAGGLLVAIDHHRGSEENQPSELYYDAELSDGVGGMSSLATFRETLKAATLEDVVVPMVTSSALAAQVLTQTLAFVFIDGGHSLTAAQTDYRLWAGRIMRGGLLAIHDVFPNPADGGRPPYEIYKQALHSGLFVDAVSVKSLRILRKL